MQTVQNKKQETIRLYVGLGIALTATALGIYLFPAVIDDFPWVTLVGALVLCYAYVTYLYLFDFSRLRSFLRSYLGALLLLCLAPSILAAVLGEFWAGTADGGGLGRVVAMLPILCALAAVARTHVIGGEPNIVISHKSLSD